MIHTADRLDMPKVASAAEQMRALNPHVEVVEIDQPVNAENAADLLRGWDLVADGSDNFATRDAVHAACLAAGIPPRQRRNQLTSGILTTFKAHLGPPHPCYRCLFPGTAAAGTDPELRRRSACSGPAVGALGSMQAIEVIKELLDIEPSLSGTLVMYDAWRAETTHVGLPRRDDCPTLRRGGRRRPRSRAAGCGHPPVTGGKTATSSDG